MVVGNISADVLVDLHVTHLFSVQIEELLSKHVLGFDDISNADDYVCECYEHYKTEESANDCKVCGGEDQELETEPREIYEWWIVSDWLANKLERRGETMCDWHGLKIWGRPTTGQAIALDDVIVDISKEEVNL